MNANNMPTEKLRSSTSSAPTQITATRSRPNTSLCKTPSIRSSLRVAMLAFIASTTRFMKRA